MFSAEFDCMKGNKMAGLKDHDPSADATDKAETKEKAKRPPHPHPLTLRPQDFADRLGVSLRYLNKLRKHPDPARRPPPHFKIGRATFWRIEDVHAWIARQGERSAA